MMYSFATTCGSLGISAGDCSGAQMHSEALSSAAHSARVLVANSALSTLDQRRRFLLALLGRVEARVGEDVRAADGARQKIGQKRSLCSIIRTMPLPSLHQ